MVEGAENSWLCTDINHRHFVTYLAIRKMNINHIFYERRFNLMFYPIWLAKWLSDRDVSVPSVDYQELHCTWCLGGCVLQHRSDRRLDLACCLIELREEAILWGEEERKRNGA